MKNISIKCLKSEKIESGSIYSQFLINSLNAGQGITIGNLLRRVLLSDIGGTLQLQLLELLESEMNFLLFQVFEKIFLKYY